MELKTNYQYTYFIHPFAIKEGNYQKYILKMLKDKNLDRRVKLAALQHHERFGGTGYPYGLMGSGIEYFSSIVAVADVYDALTSERCYKKSFSHEKAMEMILNGECGMFNPLLLECLVEIQDKVRKELDIKDVNECLEYLEERN